MRRRRHSFPQECGLYENHTAGWLVSIDTRATREYSTIDFSLHIVLVKAMYTTVLLTFFIRRPCRINGHTGKIAYNVYSSSFQHVPRSVPRNIPRLCAGQYYANRQIGHHNETHVLSNCSIRCLSNTLSTERLLRHRLSQEGVIYSHSRACCHACY